MDEERLLTVGEVADRLRLSEETVRRFLRSGKLRGVRLGSTKMGWRVYASSVKRLIAGEPQQAPAQAHEPGKLAA